MSVSVRTLVDATAEGVALRWVTGELGGWRTLAVNTLAPADLLGYMNLVHPQRVHVIGHAELAYYHRLAPERQEQLLTELVGAHPPAIVVADGVDAPAPLVQRCRAGDLPLLATTLSAARAIEVLREYLTRATAETTSVHGVLMDVLGMGVLISGESGLGKSELALELISRGHGLVADDVVEITRVAPGVLEGRCPPLLANMLEVRGLGLLDIRTIFGEAAIRRKMKLRLIVHLVRRSTMENEYQRLPLEALTQELLGVPCRKVVIPVAAGRNIAVLTEAAVRSTILQLRGIDSMGEFIARQHRQIEAGDGPG